MCPVIVIKRSSARFTERILENLSGLKFEVQALYRERKKVFVPRKACLMSDVWSLFRLFSTRGTEKRTQANATPILSARSWARVSGGIVALPGDFIAGAIVAEQSFQSKYSSSPTPAGATKWHD